MYAKDYFDFSNLACNVLIERRMEDKKISTLIFVVITGLSIIPALSHSPTEEFLFCYSHTLLYLTPLNSNRKDL